MASASVFRDEFNCLICLDLLKDPVTVACGHSFCLNCITGCWDQEDQKGVYSCCPQCRETFTPRPVLRRNIMLTEVIEKLKKTELQSDVKSPSYAGPEDVECDFCTGRKLKAIKSCLTCLGSYCEIHIQPHYEVTCLMRHKLINATSRLQDKICSQHDRIIEVFCRTDQKLICMLCLDDHNGHEMVSAVAEQTEKQTELLGMKVGNQTQILQREKELQEVHQALLTLKASAQEAVEDSERMFTELISFMEQKRSEVTESIRAQERAEVSRAEGLLEQLELDITKLKSRDADMEKLLQTEDHIDFLQSFDACCTSFVSKNRSSITFTPHLSSTDIKRPALKEIEHMVLRLNSDHKATSHDSHQPIVRTRPYQNLLLQKTGFRVGDKVRVKASVGTPQWGWRNVTHSSVGVIKCLGNVMLVEFPECTSWPAAPSEMELIL